MEQLLAALEAELKASPYRPTRLLGQGGMGAVFEVEHKSLKRKLVVKILREANRPDLEDRLRLEAQALSQLTHPNLLSVVDLAKTASGRPFIVSERLTGRTLKEVVGNLGSLAPHEAATLSCQALSGLSVAHRAGVVHRDVKLDNLFLCDGDELSPPHLKVIDFGIAKLVSAEENKPPVDVAPLEIPTAEGLMIGTPSFMSPEQVTSQPVDHRADLYGMGVVLYRLITGRNPFICADLIEYAAAHASEIPPPPSRYAKVPPGLDGVVMKALEKLPEKRFQTAKEMIDALLPFTRAPLPAPAPAPATETDPLPTTPRQSNVNNRPAARATEVLTRADFEPRSPAAPPVRPRQVTVPLPRPQPPVTSTMASATTTPAASRAARASQLPMPAPAPTRRRGMWIIVAVWILFASLVLACWFAFLVGGLGQ